MKANSMTLIRDPTKILSCARLLSSKLKTCKNGTGEVVISSRFGGNFPRFLWGIYFVSLLDWLGRVKRRHRLVTTTDVALFESCLRDMPRSAFFIGSAPAVGKQPCSLKLKICLAVPAASVHAGVYTRPNREALYDS